MDLHRLYQPLTAHPFLSGPHYREYAPSAALRPYVACFWGSEPFLRHDTFDKRKGKMRVIPDTCMDIIFRINQRTKQVTANFTGLGTETFETNMLDDCVDISHFAIRFYFWSAAVFLPDSMRHEQGIGETITLHMERDPGAFIDELVHCVTLREQIKIAEDYLLKIMVTDRLNTDILNAVYRILNSNGSCSVKDICGYACMSQRQLERLSQEYIGTSLKKMAGMVRYQNVWHDLLFSPHEDVFDLVAKYGYTDQSHLMKEFKKYHSITISEARQHAKNWI